MIKKNESNINKEDINDIKSKVKIKIK